MEHSLAIEYASDGKKMMTRFPISENCGLSGSSSWQSIWKYI